ncbi:MAG: hypothetical protein JSR77_16800 [Planctomycetes bacterium]|nr:hypothetical protein [Planctomycetota bacterium]
MDRTCKYAGCAVALLAGVALAEVHYGTDFQSGAGPEWSHRLVETAPLNDQRFLGQFADSDVSLSLPTVRAGERVNLSFDFLAIRTWDGNDGGGGPGPDIFTVSVANGPILLASTFSVGDPLSRHRMSYPAVAGVESHPSRTGAIENNSLGYTYGPNNVPLDATWRLTFNFLAPTDGLEIHFAALGLQDIMDESWGLDNVSVSTSTVPTPGSMALALTGFGLLLRRRVR